MQQQPEVPPEEHAKMLAQIQAQLFTEYAEQQPPPEKEDPLVAIKNREIDLKEQQMKMDAEMEQAEFQQEQQQDSQQNLIARERIESQEDIADMRAEIARERQSDQRRQAQQQAQQQAIQAQQRGNPNDVR